jgi:hypothetical protein
MKRAHKAEVTRLEQALAQFDKTHEPLPGLTKPGRREALARQLVDSMRRVSFVSTILQRTLSPARADPASPNFDPVRAAALHAQNGNLDEAMWLVFLSVHFGKSKKCGWELVRRVYGGGGQPWDWGRVSADVAAFRDWLSKNQTTLASLSFGNHRKYESVDAHSAAGTGSVVETYVKWVQTYGNHQRLLTQARRIAGSPADAFDSLYEQMGAVNRFGRTARFDFLTMIGKLRLAPIAPGSAYLNGATGPYRGANLLFANPRLTRRQLDLKLVNLAGHLGVGMQEIEDSLCNWQKKPDEYVPFRG